MIELGSYRQYLDCRGHGTPTIVFDSGLGDASDVWGAIQMQASMFTRACMFDRLGLGWSDDPQQPRNAAQMARELRLLLAAAGEKAPFLLVAHSMAGYNARLFVSQNPKDVTGVLLLDVAHPDQNQRESQASNDDRHDFIRRQIWWARLAPFGITRIMGHCKWSPQDCARSYRTTVDEFGPFNEISPEQVRRAGNLGNIPLVVIAHDPELQIRDDPGAVTRRDAAAELEMQKELGQLSSRSCFLIAKGSRHYVQDDRPDLVVGSLKMLSSSDLGNETQIPCAGILQH